MHNVTLDELRERLNHVREAIAGATMRSGRAPGAVRLIAVTKTHPPDMLRLAVQAGVTEIGENYLQEAEEKFSALGWPEATAGASPVVRHAIGRIQSNKVRLALHWFEVIQTVDSLKLAERIDRIAGEMGRVVPVLLQVNTSKEIAKSGFFPDEVEGILSRVAKLSHIQVQGLMMIGRFEPDPEAARSEFIGLRELRDRLQGVAPPEITLQDLSMGMSHDFPVAIEEGATIVRVGSRLFGPRS